MAGPGFKTEEDNLNMKTALFFVMPVYNRIKLKNHSKGMATFKKTLFKKGLFPNL